MRVFIFGLTLLVTGCDSERAHITGTGFSEGDPESNIKPDLEFFCTHETIPKVPDEPDILFKYGRWLQKNNAIPRDQVVNSKVERLYRIAAEHGHHAANINLQNGAHRGHFEVSGTDLLRFSQDLMNADIASGYYLTAMYLQQGLSILPKNPEAALQYFRKAADLGSAEAQEYIGETLLKAGVESDTAWRMRHCAAEQGVGYAATAVGVSLKNQKKFKEAIAYFQFGVAAGHESSASFLQEGFNGAVPEDELYYLGAHKDTERAERYDQIWRILARYSYANPKIPEINEIVPLPPAPLPAWNGKLQWLEDRLANIPPEKPSEELIRRLADEKLLEPDTGKPMPGAAGFDQSRFPLKACYSGDLCPQTGYWQIMWLPNEARYLVEVEITRHFKEGEVMPTHVAERHIVRHWPFSDKRTFTEEVVHWGLLG